jgi:hypothetical protein
MGLTVTGCAAGILPREGDTSGLGNPAEPEQEEAENEPEETVTARPCTARPPEHLIEVISVLVAEGATAAANYKIALTAAEVHYYATMKSLDADLGKFGCVGGGLGRGFVNTQELYVMKFKQAMQTKDKRHWVTRCQRRT